MSWIDVQNALAFKTSSDTWGGSIGGVVSDADAQAIRAILENLYNSSSTARTLLEAAAAMGPLHIATSPAGNPGFQGIDGSIRFIALNLSAIDTLRYFNSQGTFVSEIRALTIIHEVAHYVHTPPEQDPDYDEVAMNGAAYDFDGPIVARQNQIAAEMGYTNNVQVGYQTGIVPSDGRYSLLQVSNYTDGHAVGVVRFGDETLRDPSGAARDDNIDHTLRSDKLNDLIFGFGGDDTIKGGKGNDYIYGGTGKDKIWGGEGNDVLVGEAEDDEFRGEKGDDKIWGGAKDAETGRTDGVDKVIYDTAAVAITITLGGGTTPTLSVQDGDGGTDTLHSIEILEGSNHGDTLIVQALTAEIGAAFDYIDLGASDQDKIEISGLNGAVTVDLRDAQNQTVTFGGAVLKLKNAEHVDGSGAEDTIYLPTAAASTVTAGAGNDTIYLAGSGHSIDGGGGYDVLNLSTIVAGSRIAMASGSALIRGSGASDFAGIEEVVGGDGGAIMYGDGRGTKLVGGGGVSYLEGSGTDILVGGSGDTYFSLTNGGTIISGAGNDYIEVTGIAAATIIFGRGSGHDVVSSYFPGYRSNSLDPNSVSLLGTGPDPVPTFATPLPQWALDRCGDTILFEGLSPAEIELIWDWQGNEGNYVRWGGAAIRIKDTGDTLALGILLGHWDPPQDVFNLFLDHNLRPDGTNTGLGIWDTTHTDGGYVFTRDNRMDLRIFSFGGEKFSLLELFEFSALPSGTLDPVYNAAKHLPAQLASSDGVVAGTSAADALTGSSGDDDLIAGEGNDTITPGAGVDFVRAGAGDDIILGGAGDDNLHGGPGQDTIDYGWTTSAVNVDITVGEGGGTEIGSDKLTSLENVVGGAAGDLLIGDAYANKLAGGAGNDLLRGQAGADTLTGGAGADRLEGGAGWDSYVWRPGDGSDVLIDQGATTAYAENTLVIEGAALADFTVRRNPETLDGALTLAATGETILIPDLFAGTGAGVDEAITVTVH